MDGGSHYGKQATKKSPEVHVQVQLDVEARIGRYPAPESRPAVLFAISTSPSSELDKLRCGGLLHQKSWALLRVTTEGLAHSPHYIQNYMQKLICNTAITANKNKDWRALS